MANTKFAEPTQNIVASSYFQKKFEFTRDGTTATEPVRSCRYLNQMLKIFGNDVVIDGGGPQSVNLNSNNFSVQIGDGKIIQDSTLIKFPTFTLTFSDTNLLPGSLSRHKAIVFTKFKFKSISRDVDTDPNPLTFRLGIYDTVEDKVYQTAPSTEYPWNNTVNRVIISIIDLDNVTIVDQDDSITIKGTTYTRLGDLDSLILPLDYDGGVI